LVPAAEAGARPPRTGGAAEAPVGDGVTDEAGAPGGLRETPLLLDRQLGERRDERGGEEPAAPGPVTRTAGVFAGSLAVDLDALQAAARRAGLENVAVEVGRAERGAPERRVAPHRLRVVGARLRGEQADRAADADEAHRRPRRAEAELDLRA